MAHAHLVGSALRWRSQHDARLPVRAWSNPLRSLPRFLRRSPHGEIVSSARSPYRYSMSFTHRKRCLRSPPILFPMMVGLQLPSARTSSHPNRKDFSCSTILNATRPKAYPNRRRGWRRWHSGAGFILALSPPCRLKALGSLFILVYRYHQNCNTFFACENRRYAFRA
jgi:hypothetical protein